VIVAAGFGGLVATKALRNAAAEVVVIDRSNHHLFQPLLYQVATGSLINAEIATPLRRVLRSRTKSEAILCDVTSVDVSRKRVIASSAPATVDSSSGKARMSP
jgi:NADH dehydrogenase